MSQITDAYSPLRRSKSAINLVLTRTEDWLFDAVLDSDTGYLSSPNLERFTADLSTAIGSGGGPYLFCLCPSEPNEERGSFKNPLQLEFLHEIFSNCYQLNPAKYPVEKIFDRTADKIALLPYTDEYFASLALASLRIIHALTSLPKKVIVLDCDNTIWDGIIGEVGTEGLRPDENRTDFLTEIRNCKDNGFLLALCSKNDESDVVKAIDSGSASPFVMDDFVSWRVNWQPKSVNLKSMASELNLGLDSFIMIDDDAIECAEIREHCPEVLTIKAPANSEDLLHLVQNLLPLDVLKPTSEDRKRTSMYKAEATRRVEQFNTGSYADFLANLNLKVEFKHLEPLDIPRAVQLIQRTNQFNLTGERISDPELRQWLKDSIRHVFSIKAEDRFGDYGISGLLLCEFAADTCLVNNFLLSCRVLGKGVEFTAIRELARLIHSVNLKRIEFGFSPTERNNYSRRFLENIARKLYVTGNWEISLQDALELHYEPDEAAYQSDGDAENHNILTSSTLDLTELSSYNHCVIRAAAKLTSADQLLTALLALKPTHAAELKGGLPETTIEKALAHIWQELLNLKSVGVEDSFFEVGGHSLHMARMISEIKTRLGVEISFESVFDTPTIAGLAKLIVGDRIEVKFEEKRTEIDVTETKPDRVFPLLRKVHPNELAIIRNADKANYKDDGHIHTVGIPTKHRPEVLIRCIKSFQANAAAFERKIDFSVLDESIDPELEQVNIQHLKSLAKDSAYQICYANRDRKLKYFKKLSLKADVDERLISYGFGLDPTYIFSEKGNHNCLFIDQVGKKYLSTDDDAICFPHQIDTESDDLAVTGYHTALHFDFSNKFNDDWATDNPTSLDVVGMHEALLSKPTSSVTSSIRGKVLTDIHDPEQFKLCVLDEDRQVTFTLHGIAGDSGWHYPAGYWGHPFGLFSLQDSDLDRLRRDDDLYSIAANSRLHYRIARSTHLATSTIMIGFGFASDQRKLLPPLMPVRSGEDVIYTSILEAVKPDLLFGYLPFTLQHKPHEPRSMPPGDIFRSAVSMDIQRLVTQCVKSWGKLATGRDIESRIEELGLWLADLGDTNIAEFKAACHQFATEAIKDGLSHLNIMLSERDFASSRFHRDIQKFKSLLRQTLKRREFFIPTEYLMEFGAESAIHKIQEVFLLYGKFLQEWSKIRTAALEMNENGERLSLPIAEYTD